MHYVPPVPSVLAQTVPVKKAQATTVTVAVALTEFYPQGLLART